MQKKDLYIASIFFSFLLFSINAYSYNDESASSSQEYFGSDSDPAYTQYTGDAAFSVNAQYSGDNAYPTEYATQSDEPRTYYTAPPRRHRSHHHADRSYSGLPGHISPPGEKVIIVDPNIHSWGAYSADGTLLRSGLASAGSKWCRDLGRPCRTRAGTFRIHSLGDSSCISSKFPLGEGGAPMPYCMYFNGAQALHGSNELAEANISHGCVRMSVSSARWLRYNFAHIGTKVIVRPY
ncbi:MAG: L,D-transpeptidase [Gammaproteobacteria bacterium]